MPRTFILGIDGLPCSMWREFASSGVMPHSAGLIESGTLAPMQSSIPEVSSSAWASIVTGQNPGGHNVFGFTDLMDGGYSLGFTSSRTIKASPFWQTGGSGPSLIMNVPQTWPAQPMNGTLVSGFVALDLARAVFPSERLPLLQETGYQVDADMSVANQKDRFVADLRRVLQTRCETLSRLWDAEDWDTVMFVITGTDRLNHYLWEDFEDPTSPHHHAFLDFYSEVDRAIHEILQRLDDDTTIIAVSDHGFGRQRMSVNVNRLLHEHGYLSLADGDRPSYKDMTPQTTAFAMDPGRIYLHCADRYPAATADREQADETATALIDLFSDLEVDGVRLVDRVVRGSEVFSGPYAHRAPDLVLMAADGVALSGRIDISELIETTPINGKHTFEDSTFFVRSAEPVAVPDPMRVQDVLGVMNQIKMRRAAA